MLALELLVLSGLSRSTQNLDDVIVARFFKCSGRIIVRPAPSRITLIAIRPRRSALLSCYSLFMAVACMVLLMAPAQAAYRAVIEAPKPVKSLLIDFLDLARYQKRDDLSAEQLDFMITTAPEQVSRLMATEGYFSPKTRIKVEKNDETTVVFVDVDPGARTTISSVKIDVRGFATANSPRQVERLRREWPLVEGAPFRQEDWAEAKQSGLNILTQRRYPAARLADSEARVDADKQEADLSAAFESGPLFTLGDVKITGGRRYPESIVRNLNPLKPGEEFDSDRLLEFQRQVLRTPYYSNVVIDIDRNPENAVLAPVNVEVTEFPTQRVRGGAGYTTDTGAHVEGLYSHTDIFGRAYVLDTQLRLEQRRQYGTVSLSKPPDTSGFVDSAHVSTDRTTLSGVDLRSRRLGMRRSRETERNDFAYSLEYYKDQLSQIDGSSLPVDTVVQPGSHQALVAGVDRTARRVDNLVFPRRGYIISGQAGVAVKGLLTDQTFFRLYGRGIKYLPIGRRDLVKLRLEGGAVLSKTGNASIPASLLFRAGGTDSVRGYGYQSIGNERNGIVYPTRYIATGSAEYQHWLTEQWGGAVFYDAGTAADSWGDKSLFHAIGTGVRYRTPVGRINADLAYGIQDKKLRPHLSLGVAF